MAQPKRNPNPIVSSNLSDASAQVVLDALDAGFEIDDIVQDRGPKIRGEKRFDQESLDEIVNLSSQGAPIPGQSLTNSPDTKYPWEQPAKFANPREALNEITNLILQPEAIKSTINALSKGASVGDLASAILYAKFTEGTINPDNMLLLMEPTMYLFMAIGEEANIKYNIDEDDMDEFDLEDEDEVKDKINEFKNVFSNIKNNGAVKNISKDKIDTNVLPQSILDRVKEKGPEMQSLLSKGEE